MIVGSRQLRLEVEKKSRSEDLVHHKKSSTEECPTLHDFYLHGPSTYLQYP